MDDISEMIGDMDEIRYMCTIREHTQDNSELKGFESYVAKHFPSCKAFFAEKFEEAEGNPELRGEIENLALSLMGNVKSNKTKSEYLEKIGAIMFWVAVACAVGGYFLGRYHGSPEVPVQERPAIYGSANPGD